MMIHAVVWAVAFPHIAITGMAGGMSHQDLRRILPFVSVDSLKDTRGSWTNACPEPGFQDRNSGDGVGDGASITKNRQAA
jgi:hypothetical protein